MARSSEKIIYLQPDAPAKPAMGAPCNGCGLCCLAEPCPLGMWVSRRRSGACKALQWNASAQQYRCGMVVDPRFRAGLEKALGRGTDRPVGTALDCRRHGLRRGLAGTTAAGLSCQGSGGHPISLMVSRP
jgi:hypothetical protein